MGIPHSQRTTGDCGYARIGVAALQGRRATTASRYATATGNLTADYHRATDRIQAQSFAIGIDRATDCERAARSISESTVGTQFHWDCKRASRAVRRYRAIQDNLIPAQVVATAIH